MRFGGDRVCVLRAAELSAGVICGQRGDEKILVALNPSQNPVSCECPYGLQEVLYKLGDSVSMENGKLTVPAESAGYVKIG